MRGLENMQDEYEVFLARVESAEEVADFSSLLVDIFNAIDIRFFRENMYPRKGQAVVAKIERRRQKWVDAVESATTLSRMSFLLVILQSSVKWDMFKYCRTSSRRRCSARNRNYVEMVEQVEECEEESEESSTCRSTRTRKRKSDIGDQSDLLAPTSRYQTRSKGGNSASTRQLRSRNDVPLSNLRCYDWAQKIEEETSEEEESESEEDIEQEPEEGDTDKKNLERCLTFIKRILGWKSSALFREPVDEEDVPDYYEIIDHPISLTEIQSAIEKSYVYNIGPIPTSSRTRSAHRPREQIPIYRPEEILKGMELILDNAEMYNGQDSYVWRQAAKMKTRFIFGFREYFGHIESLMSLLNLFENSD